MHIFFIEKQVIFILVIFGDFFYKELKFQFFIIRVMNLENLEKNVPVNEIEIFSDNVFELLRSNVLMLRNFDRVEVDVIPEIERLLFKDFALLVGVPELGDLDCVLVESHGFDFFDELFDVPGRFQSVVVLDFSVWVFFEHSLFEGFDFF